jgi:hypothetical protein
MRVIELFRYDNDGRITITPNRASETDIPSKYRLVADDGMELTDGTIVSECIDIPCNQIGVWREVEQPISDSDALAILMGGAVDA